MFTPVSMENLIYIAWVRMKKKAEKVKIRMLTVGNNQA